MFKKFHLGLAVVLSSLMLSSCYYAAPSDSSYGPRSSATVSPYAFVNGLNQVDPQYANSNVVRDTWESERTYVPGEEEWFVIYDAKYGQYKAVSLQYIRSIIYYDYYSNTMGLASAFRSIENDDRRHWHVNGDPWGDDYEVVDYDYYTDLFFGRNSGFAYEDDDVTFDVSLMQSEREQREFIEKAAAISYQFSLSIDSSMSLISFGQKVQSMMNRSSGFTAEDQKAIMSDLEKLSGVSVNELFEAANDNVARQDVLERVADEIGTTASSLEHQILPQIFGLSL